MITFNCPACGKALQVDDSLAGRQGVCTFCQAVVQAPAEAPGPGGPPPLGPLPPEPAGLGGAPFDERGVDLGPDGPAVWHYVLGGQGQVPARTIHALISSGVLGPEALIWRANLGTWTTLKDVPDFAGRFRSFGAHTGLGTDEPPALPSDSEWRVPPPRRSPEADAAKVVGILSLVFGIISVLASAAGCCAVILGGVGLIAGLIGLSKPASRNLAVAGLLLSIVGIIIGAFVGLYRVSGFH